MSGMATTSPTATAAPASPSQGLTEARTVQVLALGVPIDVAGLSSAEAAEFSAAWSRCLAAPGSQAAATVHRNPGDFARANESLTSAITLAAIDQLAGHRMMFHACGLADPVSGATIAFIAPSGTGKTTVARTLGPGLGYVSDETIAVDAELRIVPYPKPLSVKQPAAGVPKLQEGPEQHLLGATPAAPRLAAIAILSRSAGETEATLEDVPLGAAILELTPQLSALARLDRGLVQLCRMVEACGGLKRIRYSEARDISALLPQLAGKAAGMAQGQDWLALPTTPQAGSAARGTGLRRATVQDAVEAGGTVFLLANSQVVELGPLGGLIWELSGDWISREALLAEVVAVVGPHPSADSLLDAALAELSSRGLLETA